MELPPPLVKLFGEVANNFLKDVGVEIFDNDIAIGESVFDLETGCDILEEHGVILCEDCIVLEGKQAEEYKARKAKEKADIEAAEKARFQRRYGPGTNSNITGNRFTFGKNPHTRTISRNAYDDNDPDGKNYEKTIGADRRRHSAGWNRSVKAIYDGQIKAFHPKDEHNVADTYNRHIRRHPKKYPKEYTSESTIFSDVEII